MSVVKKKIFTTYCPGDFEDMILAAALAGIEKGFYVDVGANDPVFRSVTKYFYDNGWNGINIEPLKKEYALLCKDRPKDLNLNIGVADKQGCLEFYIDGGATTCSENIISELKEGRSLSKEIVNVERLTDVLEKHLHKNQDIHFCKIDVEGFERNVLEGIDFTKHRPFIFCIEATYPGTMTPSHHLWGDIFLNNDYILVFTYGVNRYYADSKGKFYASIATNLNAAPIRANAQKTSVKNKLKITAFNIARFMWRLLPKRFRIDMVLPIRLKFMAKKLARRLCLDYEIKIAEQ